MNTLSIQRPFPSMLIFVKPPLCQEACCFTSGLTLAERGYRRIRGVDDLPKLMKALEKEKMEERKAA
jgi:hypothetical protein